MTDQGTDLPALPADKNKTQLPDIPFKDGRLVPDTFAGAWYLCKLIASAGFVPKDKFVPMVDEQGRELKNTVDINKTAARCLIAGQFGASLGLDLFASIQNVSVVNGQPSLWGDSMPGLCRTTGELEQFIELETGTIKGRDFTAICIVKRRGRGEAFDPEAKWAKDCGEEYYKLANACRARGLVANTFGWEEAEAAGYTQKTGSWQTNPKRMIRYRARSFALRDAFPDTLKGMRTVEEMRDVDMDLEPDESGTWGPPAETEKKPVDLESKAKDAGEKKETEPEPQEPQPQPEPKVEPPAEEEQKSPLAKDLDALVPEDMKGEEASPEPPKPEPEPVPDDIPLDRMVEVQREGKAVLLDPTEYDSYKNKRDSDAVDQHIIDAADLFFRADRGEQLAQCKKWYKGRFPEKIFPLDREKVLQQLGMRPNPENGKGYEDKPSDWMKVRREIAQKKITYGDDVFHYAIANKKMRGRNLKEMNIDQLKELSREMDELADLKRSLPGGEKF